MAQFTWTFDTPTGVYKSHAMSRRLRTVALSDAKFMDFVRTEEGMGKGRGETLTITRIAEIVEPPSAVLNEQRRIPEDEFAMSTRLVTVKELGRAVPLTSLSRDLGEWDPENPIQKMLRNQITKVLDTMAANAFRQSPVKYIPTSPSAGVFDTDGTPSTTATANMSMFHVEEISDYLYDVLKAEPAMGDDYMGIFRRKGLRGIMRDPAWEEWHKYTDPQAKANGEVGRIEKVRFIETNHEQALGTKGAGSVLGEGFIFGDDAVMMAEVLAPELRVALPGDFGRSQAVAWYGILTMDTVWETANPGECKIVHITSA